MKKSLLLLVLMLMVCIPAMSEYYTVSVPDLPNKSAQESYEDSEEIFIRTVLQYYYIAAGIETLIRNQGATPNIIVPIPSEEELSDNDFKIIRRYHAICIKLKNQYDIEKMNYRDAEIDKLFNRLQECSRYNFSLQAQNRALMLENNKLNFYKGSNEQLIYDIENQYFVIDSLNWELYNSKAEIIKEYHKKQLDKEVKHRPVFSLLSGVSKHYYYNDAVVENNGFNGQLVFNPGPISRFGQYIDIRGGLQHYSLDIRSNSYFCTSYEYSLDLILPISRLMEVERFNFDFKIGTGFFHSKNYAVNTGIDENKWHGELIRLELDAYNFGYEFPIGLYISYAFYHNSKMPKFDNYYLNSEWVTNLSIGLSFALWNKPVY